MGVVGMENWSCGFWMMKGRWNEVSVDLKVRLTAKNVKESGLKTTKLFAAKPISIFA